MGTLCMAIGRRRGC